jgi:hypothetical protein
LSGQDVPLAKVRLAETVKRPEGNQPTPRKERLVWIVDNGTGNMVLVRVSKALGALQSITARRKHRS